MTEESKLSANFADIVVAATRIRSHIVHTPLLEFPDLNRRTGGRILIKAEMFQPTGSFKVRGAFNKIIKHQHEAQARGVLAWSSGNHAQAVALAAAQVGAKSVILMPSDAPKVKIEATQRYGAEIILYNRATQDREELGRELAEARGSLLVKPFDDPDIIAGQGTVGLEILQQLDSGAADLILVPCSGGGLAAGMTIAIHEERPDIAIYAVEPKAFDDTRRSLAEGRRVRLMQGASSICDALQSPTPGELTFAINSRHLRDSLSCTDDEVIAAISYAFRSLKIVLEPGGAIGLAAVLSRSIDCSDKTVVVVASGGNADAADICRYAQ